MARKKVITTFLTSDPKIRGKLMKLGHAFTQAVAQNDARLAQIIEAEALALKSGSEELIPRDEGEPCPEINCQGTLLERTPPGFGQVPKLVCTNPRCPSKRRKSRGFGN